MAVLPEGPPMRHNYIHSKTYIGTVAIGFINGSYKKKNDNIEL